MAAAGALSSLKKPTESGALQAARDKVLSRDPFSYNYAEDPLYQQYRDSYTRQGRLAMADTMGQASALTGGYGNSYAATAGQQTYNGYMQRLNDVIPELYQLAYDRYQNGLAADRADYQMLYGAYRDQVGDYYTDYGNAYTNYRDTVDLGRGLWNDRYTMAADARDFAYTQAKDAYEREQDELRMLLELQDYGSLAARGYDTSRLQALWGATMSEKNASAAAANARAAAAAAESSAQKSGKTETQAKKEADAKTDPPSLYVYGGIGTDGRPFFYRDGKQYTFAYGVNPYTGTHNPDIEYGTFANGYQPDNVKGKKLRRTGDTTTVNGRSQAVWQTDDGTRYVWDGMKNAYQKVEP